MGMTDGAAEGARAAAREAAPWVERLARLGYMAKGVVYVLVGLVAAQVGLTSRGGRVEGSQGALERILHAPMGRVALGVVALGLVGYALWGFVRAALDPEGHGDDGAGAMLKRVGYAITGVTHTLLAWQAVRLLRGTGGGGGDNTSGWTATVMDKPLGRWLVAAAGLGIAGYGIRQLVRAWREKVGEKLDLSQLSGEQSRWVVRLGRFGLGARGVVFVMIGWFLVRAAMTHDPGKARGLEGALRTLGEQPYGPWLLGIVGLGLAAYGLYEVVQGRYRRIRAG